MQYMRLILTLALINFAGIALCEMLRHGDPVKNLYLGAQDGHLVLFGKNSLGHPSVRIFKKNDELLLYTETHQIKLPQPCDACQGGQSSAHMNRVNATSNKLTWTLADGKNMALNFHDLANAQFFAEHLRFNGLQASPVGFAIPLN